MCLGGGVVGCGEGACACRVVYVFVCVFEHACEQCAARAWLRVRVLLATAGVLLFAP